MARSATTEPFTHAYLLDGNGGGRKLDWQEIVDWKPEDGVIWLHFNYTDADAQNWLTEDSGLPPLAAEALITEETRPRVTSIGNNLLIALRGINHNAGAEPEDMVAIRLWAEKGRLISTARRSLLSVSDLISQLDSGKGGNSTADLLADLTDFMVWRMNDTIGQYEEMIDDLEERVLDARDSTLRFELASLRRSVIAIRRYLAPERDALTRLTIDKSSWLEESHRMRLREVADRLMRHVEDLDAVRERASVTHEELLSRISEQMNNRMYMLSIVAAIFLPLGFLTGLLGINVGGIPGAEHPWGFYIFSAIIVVIVLLQLWLFRLKQWL